MIDWFDLPTVQGTLKSLLQHHRSKASILWQSTFFIVQLSHPHVTTGKTIALTRQIFVGKIMSLLFFCLCFLICCLDQSILKEIGPGCFLEGMMLKLKLQYFGHLMRRVDLLEKTLMLGGIGGRRRRGRQRMRWLDGITDSSGREFEWTPGVGDRQGGLVCCNSWDRKESNTTERLNWLTDWLRLVIAFVPRSKLTLIKIIVNITCLF